ncbi:MAG: hypothetical protein ACRC6E_09820 [Fusobacteriaceae bacterium]
MEQLERIKGYVLAWSPSYDLILLELDIKEAMQRILNYINYDVFPEELEIILAKELYNSNSNSLPSNAISIKESETTVQLAPQSVNYDVVITNIKKVLFRYRKLK